MNIYQSFQIANGSWTSWTDTSPCPDIRFCGRTYTKTQIQTCINTSSGIGGYTLVEESFRNVTCPDSQACQGTTIKCGIYKLS